MMGGKLIEQEPDEALVTQKKEKVLTQMETIASKIQPSRPVKVRYVSPIAKTRLPNTLVVEPLSHPPPPPPSLKPKPWLALKKRPLLTKLKSFKHPPENGNAWRRR